MLTKVIIVDVTDYSEKHNIVEYNLMFHTFY